MNSQAKIASNVGRLASSSSGWPRLDLPPFNLASPFGVREVWTAAHHDLFGTKDVQDAITASYVWMADQIGHVFLGLAPTLLLCWLWNGVSALPGIQAFFFWPPPPGYLPVPRPLYGGYVLAALPVFAYWVYKELQDRADSRANARGVFDFDDQDIEHNVLVALQFFATGGILAVSAFVSFWALVAAFILLSVLATLSAYWWLKRKLAFQQANLPYLFRLTNFPTPIPDGAQHEAVVQLSCAPGKGKPDWRRHLIITGPLDVGKTSLCVGIGTEFAFHLGLARYMPLTDLLQWAVDLQPGNPAPNVMDYDAGRYLWPWQAVELLLIDDVDIGLGGVPPLVKPYELRKTLAALLQHVVPLGSPPLGWIGPKRSVWVLGETANIPEWQEALAAILGIVPAEIGVVELHQAA